MALDDAGIEAVIDKKGRIVVKKKDIKKAEKVLSKSFKRGGEPDLYHEEVELSEEVADILIRKGVGKMSKQQVAGKVMTNARKLFGLDASVNGMNVRISGTKKKVNDYLAVIIGRSSSGDATQVTTTGYPNLDKQLTKDLNTAHGGIGPGLYREDVEMDEAKGTAYPPTIENLRMIVKDKQHQKFMFDKGQAIVDTFTASAMIAVYDAMKKPEIKKKFEEMIKSKEGFMKTQAFAMKMIK